MTHFEEAKNKLVLKATNYAARYLLSKYGSAHLIGEPTVELTATEGPTSSSFVFNGAITVVAASDGLLNQVGVNMTVNENDIEVTSEDVQANISSALNAAEEHADRVVASLDSFKLVDDGSKYLKVSHSDLQDANLGIVGKNEYAASPDKSELLQNIVKDAMLETPISFTGEFKEPVIEKVATEETDKEDKERHEKRPHDHASDEECPSGTCKKASSTACPECGRDMSDLRDVCSKCEEESKSSKKSSWLTADLDEVTEETVKCPGCNEEIWDYAGGGMTGAKLNKCWNCGLAFDSPEVEASTVAIKEDMPMARSHDSMAELSQTENQVMYASKSKMVLEAENALVTMLQGMGYGTAKVAEVTDSKDGFDIMAVVDDAAAVKAVSIPVVIKDAKVILPKKALVATLISKGLDIRAKLSEQFDVEVLEKLAAIEEKTAYETAEAEAILAERPAVTKAASGSTNEMFLSETDVLEVQKHLLPNHEKMKKGDKISDGANQWELVDTDGNQNDKNKDSASIWKFKKCAPPKSDEKEPDTKVKA